MKWQNKNTMEMLNQEINETALSYINKIREKCSRINPLVVISCITYNHQEYLRDALDGFVMQQTDFPFVAVVHDDASTDGTASIIREYAEKYPDIILPIYETENQYSKHDGSLGRIMAKAHGATMAKYIAECEGDDFWTVPYKLKKQVNFLESHPDYSMCCHNYKTIFENSTDEIFHQEETDKIICFEDVYNGEIQTATTVFRRELYQFDKYIKLKQIKNCPFGDYIVFISAMLFGKVMKFHDNMSIYRRHEGSATDLFKYHIEDFIRSHKYISNVANTEHLLNSYLSKIFMSVLIDSIKRKQNSSVALKLWSSAPLQCTQRLIRFCFNYFSFKIKHLA